MVTAAACRCQQALSYLKRKQGRVSAQSTLAESLEAKSLVQAGRYAKEPQLGLQPLQQRGVQATTGNLPCECHRTLRQS